MQMRTAIDLDEDLLQAIKRISGKTGKTKIINKYLAE
jgi:Arc/MetJ family transcription regulator